MTVKEASVVFGTEDGSVGPLLVNLVFANTADRPVEILWSESSISIGEENHTLVLGLSHETPRNAAIPAKKLYAQSVAAADSVVKNSASDSLGLACMPQGVLRIRVIYRDSPGGLPSAFSVVLTPSSER